MDSAKIAPYVQNLGLVENTEMLEHGRELYVHRCSKCHNALRITRYTKKKWSRVLPSMVKLSKFDGVEKEAVAAYISAVLQNEKTRLDVLQSANDIPVTPEEK